MSEEKKTEKDTLEAIRKDLHTTKNIMLFYLWLTIICIVLFLMGIIATAGQVITQ